MHHPETSTRRGRARRSGRRALLGATVFVLITAALPGRAEAALPTWPADPDWQSLVPAPTSDSVRAATVNRTSGSVTNAAGLAGPGTGSTVLTTTSTTSPATVILDFGKEVGGTPFATVSAWSASGGGSSATLRIATSEALPYLTASNGVYNNDNGSPVTFAVNGAKTYTGSLRGGFRFAAIQLTTAGSVTLTGAGVNFKAYRATSDKYKGYFISSDDQLNRMWYAGAYTAQMDMVPAGVSSCFTTPVIFDGAKRDRAVWSGDLMVTDPVAQLSLGSNSATYVKGAIKSVFNLQSSNGRLTSAVGFQGCGKFDYAMTYSAYSAIIAIQYYRYTNDTAFINGLRTKLEAAATYHATRLDANGLVVTNDNDYWQTGQSGEVTEYSLAYYELLQNMIWMEGKAGTAAKVTEYTNKAAALRTAINGRLWNASSGLYVHTNTRTNVFPLDANMNAIRLGVAPADKVQGILNYFKSHWQAHGSQITQPSPSMADPTGHTIEPLDNTWEVMARFGSADTAGALDLMRRLWGVQVETNSGYYTGTFWEFVGSNGLPSRGFDSLAHAWGAGPTQLLTENVLGATAVNPGYATWQVKPQAGTLTWAQGQIPTAGGTLTVKWARDTTGQFHLQVISPGGTGGQVWVPLSSTSATSTATTAGATLVQRNGLYDIYSVGAGTFEFSSTP